MQSRLAVLLVADLVDYTRLMADDEQVAIGAIRELKNSHLEPVAVRCGGEILKRMGDGWIIAFSSVSSAIKCATDVQAKLAGHALIKLRMGCHIGEITEDETDFYGAAVNLAQRLQTEAPPGGVMISQDMHRQLSGGQAKSFVDAGSFKLKNIALPVAGFQWRPEQEVTGSSGELPTMTVERFDYAPDDSETRAAAADLYDQLVQRLSRRTGIRVLDGGLGPAGRSTYLLRGRLRISNNRGRLNLTLVLCEDGQTMLSQTYESDITDIFSFCDELIARADTDLRLQINAFDGDRIAHLPDEKLSVSELRSRAAGLFYVATIKSWQRCRQVLERAHRLSLDDPMALAMLSEVTVLLAAAHHQGIPQKQMDALETGFGRAVEAVPRSDYVFWARAVFRIFAQGDAAEAIKDANRSLRLNPAYVPAYEALGQAQLLAGDFDAAVKNLGKAASMSEHDPLLPSRSFMHAVGLVCVERYLDGILAIDRAIELRPNEHGFHVLRGYCLRKTGDEAAAEKCEALVSRLPGGPSAVVIRPPLPESQAELLQLFSLE